MKNYMIKIKKYPLQVRLENLANSKKIKLARMSPEQVKASKMRLDDYFQEEFEKLNPKDANENPIILIGRNQKLSLSYLGLMVGYVGKTTDLLYHPEGIIVAENKYKTLVLHAVKFDKTCPIYNSGSRICCQLVDRMLLRLSPKEFKEKGVGIYYASFNLNQTNLNHLMRLLKGVF